MTSGTDSPAREVRGVRPGFTEKDPPYLALIALCVVGAVCVGLIGTVVVDRFPGNVGLVAVAICTSAVAIFAGLIVWWSRALKAVGYLDERKPEKKSTFAAAYTVAAVLGIAGCEYVAYARTNDRALEAAIGIGLAIPIFIAIANFRFRTRRVPTARELGLTRLAVCAQFGFAGIAALNIAIQLHESFAPKLIPVRDASLLFEFLIVPAVLVTAIYGIRQIASAGAGAARLS